MSARSDHNELSVFARAERRVCTENEPAGTLEVLSNGDQFHKSYYVREPALAWASQDNPAATSQETQAAQRSLGCYGVRETFLLCNLPLLRLDSRASPAGDPQSRDRTRTLTITFGPSTLKWSRCSLSGAAALPGFPGPEAGTACQQGKEVRCLNASSLRRPYLQQALAFISVTPQ